VLGKKEIKKGKGSTGFLLTLGQLVDGLEGYDDHSGTQQNRDVRR
jgi:hypothetical protein